MACYSSLSFPHIILDLAGQKLEPQPRQLNGSRVAGGRRRSPIPKPQEYFSTKGEVCQVLKLIL